MRGMPSKQLKGMGGPILRMMGTGIRSGDKPLAAPIIILVGSNAPVAVPRGARYMKIEAVQAGYDGTSTSGGNGGAFAITENVKVSASSAILCTVGASNGSHTTVSVDGNVVCDTAVPLALGGIAGQQGGFGGGLGGTVSPGSTVPGGGGAAGPFGGGGGGARGGQPSAFPTAGGNGGSSATGMPGGTGGAGASFGTGFGGGGGGGGSGGSGSSGEAAVYDGNIGYGTGGAGGNGGPGLAGQAGGNGGNGSPAGPTWGANGYAGGGGGGAPGGGGGASTVNGSAYGQPGKGARGEIRITFTRARTS